MSSPDHTEDLLAGVSGEALAGTGLLVDHVQVTPAGKRRVVTVAVDRDLADLAADDHTSPVSGVDLDTVADATRRISDALDAADPFGEVPYTLEVTTPGLSRPLTEPRHFRRNVGRLVEITPQEGPAVRGRITAADAEAVTVAVEPAPVKGRPARRTGEERSFPYPDIARARIEVEFVSDASGSDDGDDDDQLDDQEN